MNNRRSYIVGVFGWSHSSFKSWHNYREVLVRNWVKSVNSATTELLRLNRPVMQITGQILRWQTVMLHIRLDAVSSAVGFPDKEWVRPRQSSLCVIVEHIYYDPENHPDCALVSHFVLLVKKDVKNITDCFVVVQRNPFTYMLDIKRIPFGHL